ncbi:hypothetical protein CC80DRAFT_573101 [Byssothecium circinans]|uniref:Uncharacterized protein n=1 Tax=Byssothecium circinans TaxID=147558 RepID=A0A6A5THF1_9PLEO|nr:hypothetical protein CC80DRAFT_573101 [Byssothecium circinans]
MSLNSNLNSASTAKGDDSVIRKQTSSLLEIHPSKVNGWNVGGIQSAFLPPILGNGSPPVGTPEIHTCHEGHSRAHLLQCGHYVLCPAPTYCGKNRQTYDGFESNTPIRCTLCVRRTFNWDMKHYNRRWYDLLLPTFIKAEKEAIDADEFAYFQRVSEPMYIDNHGNIVRPMSHFAIAMIRALEYQKEDAAKKDIRTACADASLNLGNDAAQVATCAIEYLDILLRQHHKLDHLPICIIANFAICLVLIHRGRKYNSNVVLTALGVASESDTSQIRHWQEAKKCISSSKAGDIIDVFLTKAHRQLRQYKSSKKLYDTARRLWHTAARAQVIPKRLLKNQEEVLPLACLAEAAAELKIPISFPEICRLTGVNGDAWEAKVVWAKVHLFAKNSDRRNLIVRQGDPRVKEKQLLEMQDEEAVGVGEAIAQLGSR